MLLEVTWKQAFGDNQKVYSRKQVENIREVLMAFTAGISQPVFERVEVDEFIEGLIKRGKLKVIK